MEVVLRIVGTVCSSSAVMMLASNGTPLSFEASIITAEMGECFFSRDSV